MNAGDARGLESVPQEDTLQDPAPQPKLEHKVEETNRIVAQLLEVADAFRMTFFKAMNLAQSVSHPQAQRNKRISRTGGRDGCAG
jgi:autophagy-related protein 11